MSRSSSASFSETHDYPVDFDDYTLEVTDALSSTLDYSGELDSPPLDVDEYFVLEAGQARLNGGGDDSESDRIVSRLRRRRTRWTRNLADWSRTTMRAELSTCP
jgi:hypothetical protein